EVHLHDGRKALADQCHHYRDAVSEYHDQPAMFEAEEVGIDLDWSYDSDPFEMLARERHYMSSYRYIHPTEWIDASNKTPLSNRSECDMLWVDVVIEDVQTTWDANANEMAWVTISDGTDIIDVPAFSDTYESYDFDTHRPVKMKLRQGDQGFVLQTIKKVYGPDDTTRRRLRDAR
ncbi:MAG: hypothetical protein ABEN55_05020, partial [Bradymonadaceae bacterium]